MADDSRRTRKRRHQLASVHAGPDRTWRLPWMPMTVLAAVGTAAATWLLVAGFCVLGWFAVTPVDFPAVLEVATRGWLLAHGASINVGPAILSTTPLGATGVVVAMGLGACQLAARHSHPPERDQRPVRWLRSGLTFSLTYVVILVVVRAATRPDGVESRPMFATICMLILLGLGGFVRPLGLRPARPNRWVEPVLRGVIAAWLWMIAVGAVVMVTALLSGTDRVVTIHESLQPGVLGGIMLLIAQLMWLPNMILWAGAWAIGAGVQIGVDTVVSPVTSQVGLLPAIPVLGIIPDTIAMPVGHVIWLASGLIAGGIAATLVLRGVDVHTRVDLSALVGASSGVVSGIFFAATQLLANGDLGMVRLIDIGARMGPLLIMAPTAMGIGGLLVGVTMGMLGRGRGASELLTPTSVVVDRRIQPSETADE